MPTIDAVQRAIARGFAPDAVDASVKLARRAFAHHRGLRIIPDGDPRKPQRPDGDAGASWVVCREPMCGRGAAHLRDIRHRKNCPLRSKVNRPGTEKRGNRQDGKVQERSADSSGGRRPSSSGIALAGAPE